ncbi:MAG: hypothetical protein JNK65_07845 [Deltaproteobacteria bacterium]|nr:hypothetical protein [Deltaproteobacteria bacterium]
MACFGPVAPAEVEEESDPAEVAIGERLFRDPRFAEFFFSHSEGKINIPLISGDPVLEKTHTINGTIPGIFAGQSMSCVACHMVDDHLKTSGGGMRSYADFAARSPIPIREDGKQFAPRNSPSLVNSTSSRDGNLFLHFDGEFSSIEELVQGTLTGRNFGWLPTEKNIAITHVADIIRKDDGSSLLAQQFGGLPYATLLKGTDRSISEDFRIPPEFRIDVYQSSNEQIVDGISKLIGAYVKSLSFSQAETGEFNGSPYDLFLKKNGLPQTSNPGESNLDYSRRLLQEVLKLKNPQTVSSQDKTFQFHSQDFSFGALELKGMKIFFSEPSQKMLTSQEIATGGIGNCIACHAAPLFTDFKFHNTGAAQAEFDDIHGAGAFSNLYIPSYAARSANPALFLPPTSAHPDQVGTLLDIPNLSKPSHTDLGLWNVFANDDIPSSQNSLLQTLCQEFKEEVSECHNDQILPLTIAYFKTPSLRDLGHSAPFMHTGQMNTLESVAQHYLDFSKMARTGNFRNPSKEMKQIALNQNDLEALVAFIQALNEDYQ